MNDDWFLKLIFLRDIMTQLNELNVHLHGPGQKVGLLELFGCWKGFAFRLGIFCCDIHAKTFKYFPHVNESSFRPIYCEHRCASEIH